MKFVDGCAIPHLDRVALLLFCSDLLNEVQELFRCSPGRKNIALHYILTIGSPVCIPPQCTPVHYTEKIEEQIQGMLDVENMIVCGWHLWWLCQKGTTKPKVPTQEVDGCLVC